MSQYVAFMRAINVGGHGSVKMSDLREAFTAAGCRNVTTYIQSGNVLFDSAESGIPAVLRRLRISLRKLLGDEPDVILRTAGQLDAILARDPFKKVRSREEVKFSVVFLSQPPQHRPRLPLVVEKEAFDIIAIDGKDVFVVSRRKKNGMFGFPNAFIEKEFRLAATTRNWNTVTKIAALTGKSLGEA